MNTLLTRFQKKLGDSFIRHLSLANGESVSFGFETRLGNERYRWNGLKRGGDMNRPHWLFQYTFAGHGFFSNSRTTSRVGAGEAFCVKIPSSHMYWNDPGCGKWTFFWVVVRHSYVVSRFLAHDNLVNAVLPLRENSPPLLAAAALCLEQGKPGDFYDAEKSLFHWMLEMERWAFAQRHPADERERLMNFVRELVMERLDGFVSVEELADASSMSRSNFAHHFRKVTGHSPAAFIRDIRLREASRLLGQKALSVKEVAARTGFADTNHLCKCFREHLQISPGTYRRLQPGR